LQFAVTILQQIDGVSPQACACEPNVMPRAPDFNAARRRGTSHVQ